MSCQKKLQNQTTGYFPEQIEITELNGPIQQQYINFPFSVFATYYIVNDSNHIPINNNYTFQNTELGTITVNSSGTITYGNFNTNNKSYKINVYIDGQGLFPFEITINSSMPTPPSPPPPVPNLENAGYFPNYSITDFNKENAGIFLTFPFSVYVDSYEVKVNDNQSGIKLQTNTQFNFDYPLTGYISVNSSGTIKFGNFTTNNKYTIDVNIAGQGLYPFTILVQGTVQPNPIPEPPVISFGYSPNAVELKWNSNSVTQTFISQSSVIVNKFIINTIEYKPDEIVTYNTGHISVNSTGTITYGGFSMNATYNIIVKTSLGDVSYYIIVFDIQKIVTDVQYLPNIYSVPINSENKTVKLQPFGQLYKVNNFTVNNSSDIYTTIYKDNTGTISVDKLGNVTFGGFTNQKIYNLKISVEGYGNIPLTISVGGDIEYIPSTVVINLNKSDVIKLQGDVEIINYFNVNDKKYEIGQSFEDSGGTISVNQIGTVTYGNFTKKNVYNVSVNADGKNIPLKIIVGDDNNIPWYNKLIFGIELWLLLVIILCCIIVIVIIVICVIYGKKNIQIDNFEKKI